MDYIVKSALALSEHDVIVEQPRGSNKFSQYPIAGREVPCDRNKVHVRLKKGPEWCYDANAQVMVRAAR